MPRPKKPANPFRYFNSSPEVIRLVVMMYVRYPLSLRNVEDLLFEREIDICHETVRFRWNRFGAMFVADIRRQRVSWMRGLKHWNWQLDEMVVKIGGEMHYLWRAVDQEDGPCLHQEGTETPWLRGGNHTALLRRSAERAGQSRKAGERSLGEQPGGKQPPALSATRAGNAQIPADEIPANVRFSPRLVPHPLRRRPPPH